VTRGGAGASAPLRRVAPIAPAGPFDPELAALGAATLCALGPPGLTVTPAAAADPDPLRPYLAGSDGVRAEGLLAALEGGRADPGGALWLIRGGYGCVRTLEALGDRLAVAPPATLWAFSDGTALLAAWQALGWPAWHAPPLVQLPRLDPASRDRLVAATHRGEVPPFEGLTTLAPGRARGHLAGGNLCVLASLVGTPWAPALDGAILVVEDVGEALYRVDRALTQLRLAGLLEGVCGVVLGDLIGVPPEHEAARDDLFRGLAADLGVPAARDLPVGHGERNAPLPFGPASGFVATLDATGDGARLTVAPTAAPGTR